MKKIILYLTIISCGVFTSCETDDTAGVSQVTNYAVFDLAGPQEIFLHKGEEYVEPGATATEAGEPVDVSVSGTGIFRGGDFNTDVSDFYNLTYSAVNKDGFVASASRTVVVAHNGDLKTDISGLYRSTIVRDGNADPQYADLEYILIWQNADGTFSMNDVTGGYYWLGRGYGLAYAGPGGKITVNGENDFSYGPAVGVGAFGGSAVISDMSTDAAAKTIDFNTTWDVGSSHYVFAVHLEQVQF